MGPWEDILSEPLPGRRPKPRKNGLTMVIDSGMGIRSMRDIVECAGEWIDFWKFGFGTSFLYSSDLLKAKISLLRESRMIPYPGGTLFETALLQGRADRFLTRAEELGFPCIEISDGTVEIDGQTRRQWIREAKRRGFLVLTETGKKKAGLAMTIDQYVDQLEKDLSSGSDYVILEGRESGRNVGFYREDGSILEEEIGRLMARLSSPDRVIWEAPRKSQQEFFLRRLGVNVNLGNIHPGDVVAVETLRRGLRSDTLRWTIPPSRIVRRSDDHVIAGVQF
ncbi:MAG: phosphosulfolactate synthase [Kyrpidia sp.]|nr:phosphosulfolactate synthase [Kyrpidia sp.]